ncbi:MAG: S-methyl-5-thioribose-1-phosphate isomerase [Candidatus Freyarchaeota archaeon]|nr:S-methyl-5-thioribose-1-phosphate isomerase [Candidatus Jordarchaeia archaeon]
MKVKVGGEVKEYQTVWMEEDVVCMIDQTTLPFEFSIHRARNVEEVAEAIMTMKVRGAPAIGVTACYGLAQAAIQNCSLPPDELKALLSKVAARFLATRPTAVDMKNMVTRVLETCEGLYSSKLIAQAVLHEARRIAQENVEACRKIGELGSSLISEGARILVHCNPGALGTVDYGTALSIVRFAHTQGKNIFVYVTETRPWLQGRLTSWELTQEGVPHCLIVDAAAGYYLQRGEIDVVLVGADRILPNGDVINKIGTYMLAVAAHENGVPFIVAAPTTTLDSSSSSLKVEERFPEEVTHVKGYNPELGETARVRIHPDVRAKNPAFDVTPAKYVTLIVTEKGIFKPDKIRT